MRMALGSCYTCNGVPPICPECIQQLSERWASSARAFGWRWGARLRITMDVRGDADRSWPAWEGESARNLRRICRKIVEPLASTVPEPRDERIVEIFAHVCAAAGKDAYHELTLEDARMVVTDWDRRFPTWQSDLIQRLRA
jgi:hypothetical protein